MPDVTGFDDFYRGSRQRWSTVSAHDDPEAWMRVAASWIAVSRWRSLRSRARAHLRHGPVGEVPAPSTDTVAAPLRQLPEEQRVAIALYYLVGMPVADVARETGVPVGTVKARLSRERAALASPLTIMGETADA